MPWMSFRWSASSWCVGLVLSLSQSACLFPVIDFEEHSAPREVAFHSASSRPLLSTGTGTSARIMPRSEPPPPTAATRTLETRNTSLARDVRAGPKAEKPSDHPFQFAAATRTSKPASTATPAGGPDPVLLRAPNEEACYKALWRDGVGFNIVPRKSAPGVPWPIRLKGDVRGVTFAQQDHTETHEILDCRLAMALSEWARQLRRAGVKRVEYYSMYRPGARIAGSGSVSGHAHGLAIDAARFSLQNGKVADVQEDWEGRTRGEAPCPLRSDEDRESRLLRSVTCSAADRRLFQVVLTPHYNHAHDNHVHLEVKPDVSWTYVR